jgi:argininosuccinate lyase
VAGAAQMLNSHLLLCFNAALNAAQTMNKAAAACCVSCRGKAGKLQGNLMGVMAVLKGTPTTYNKDFQECWELMFDSVDALHDCIRIATGVLSTIKINPDRMMKVGMALTAKTQLNFCLL